MPVVTSKQTRSAHRSDLLRIGVTMDSESPLFPLVDELLRVRFQKLASTNDHEFDALLVATETNSVRPSGIDQPVLSLPTNGTLPGPLTDIEVRFADDSDVPFPFRGRSVRTKIGSNPQILFLQGSEKPLATTDAGVVWTTSTQSGAKQFRSAFPLPIVAANTCFFDLFNGERFLELLPLLDFLNHVRAPQLFSVPPISACFIIDDPNLHWSRYGFVDYEQIAADAAQNNYHVAFAPIPIDSWFAHPSATKIFKDRSEQISLLVHGNNHTRNELASALTSAQQTELLQQAVHRIRKLETKTALTVSRVMAPPHGACSESMLEQLPGCGFDGATISYGSLRKHNRSSAWVPKLGYRSSENIAGCPVLPRAGLGGNVTNTILISAFLKQPIILMGHHEDFSQGPDFLGQFASVINSLGAVSWNDMAGIFRGRYEFRRSGDALTVRPFTNKIEMELDEPIASIQIDGDHTKNEDRWKITSAEGSTGLVATGTSVAISVPANGRISIEKVIKSCPNENAGSVPPARWAVVRRLLTEGRDRVRPLVGRGR